MKIKQLLRALTGSTAITIISYDSWILTRKNNMEDKKSVEEINNLITELKKKNNQISQLMDEVNAEHFQNSILESSVLNMEESRNNLKDSLNKYQKLVQEFTESKESPERSSSILERIDACQLDVVKRIQYSLKDQEDLTSKLRVLKTDTSESLQTVHNTTGNINNTGVQNNNIPNDFPTENIQESNLLGSLSDLRSAIQDGLSGLSSEEICCLFNSIGFFIILTFVFSIITTLMGKKIIDYFNLETKYPKLSKYFKFRAKMDHYYIIFNIFMIVLVSIIYMGINLYMFYTFES